MEDCYFWVDKKVEDDPIINTMCVDCRKQQTSIDAWFWHGSNKGYGPFEYQCEFCKKIIKTKKD